MWSFDDEENKNSPDHDSENENAPKEDPRDDFSERDPFSRGGDFYRSYNGIPDDNGGMNGQNRPRRPKKSGILPAILICAIIILLTVATVYMLGDGFSLAGIGVGRTTASTSTTLAPGTNNSTTGTTGTAATAPGITEGTTGTTATTAATAITPSYVYWDTAVVERCLNASVLISVESVGSGSGVIYTQDGYILTNYHVVSNNNHPITVTLFNGTKVPATYIYGDESNDISVIKIEKNDCVYAEVSTAPVSYMMPVMVIGNALGKGFNTTQGVVSAPASEVYFSSTYETMTLIQIDAAVNSGNSGGGLFNTKGELIGIVNAKLSGTSPSGATIESMGYAIPMSSVTKCVNDLNKYGYVTGVARLGVEVHNYLQVGIYATKAVVVQSLVPNGSAALSGMKEKDIIYSINGQTITSFETLGRILTAYSVGDTVELTILRPTNESAAQKNPLDYMRSCEEVKIPLKFVEFNPNA